MGILTSSAPRRQPSVCPHDCPSTCALEIEVLDEHTIGRVYGAKDNTYTQGVICAKVSRYQERVHHPDRMGVPLRRIGDKGSGLSAYEPIDWSDALDIVAENMRRVIEEYSAEAIWPYHYAGTMGLIQRDGIERFRNVLGTSRQHSTFCVTLADAGWNVGIGEKRGADAREMINSELIVVWGGNPVNTQVNVMHHIAKARRKNNAKLVVVDPYLTGTAKKADLHLMLRPGTDGALACAVMHVLFRGALTDPEYMRSYTDWPVDLEAHLAERTPQWAAEITGLTVAEIEQFAQWYGATKKSFIRVGYGFSRSRNGAANVHAVTCLPAITGAWQVPGGGALYGNRAIYPVDTNLIQGTDQQNPNVRTLDQSLIGEVLCGNPKVLAGGPPIQSLFVQNTNPMVVAPDSNRVKEGFMRDDLFVCVHEQFMTETAAMADIVLPATMFMEHADIYTSSGHSHLQITRKLIEPFADCRTNHWVLSELAMRLGLKHPGFELNEWELIGETLRASGLPDADSFAKKKWLDSALPFEQTNFLSGFATPDQRFHFRPDWSRVGPDHVGMPLLPDHWNVIDEPTDEHPFRLVTAPARQFLNTSFTEAPTSRKMEKRPQLLIHPDDCERLGLKTDTNATVGNSRGEIVIAVQPFTGVTLGTVVVESIWPGKDMMNGVGVNALVSSQPAQPNGGAVFHDTAVWVRPSA